MYTRDAFTRQQTAVKQAQQRNGRPLAFLSVVLGFAQLLFLRWADQHMARGPRMAAAGAAFLMYVALIAWLFFRMQRAVRIACPRCPQCGVALKDMSERVAVATGRCDACGGQVIEQA